jgi:hypothetical protein
MVVSIRNKCSDSFALEVAALISVLLDVEIVYNRTEAQAVGPPLRITIIFKVD